MSSKLAKAGALTGALILAGVATTGCATKAFVRDQVAVVDTKVDTKVGAVDTKVNEVSGTAREALDRATAAGKLAEGKFLYEVVLSDDSVKFPVNHHDLSPEAQTRLGELVARLKAENKNVYLEIQGHTDNTGNPEYNDKLGEERAEAVRRYLSMQGVALNRMATISYGQSVPVAPNNSRDGRAQNRRVAIVVLS